MPYDICRHGLLFLLSIKAASLNLSLRGSVVEEEFLLSDDKTSNGSRGERSHDTREKGRDGKTRDITTSRRSKLTEDTNLDTQGTNVAETAAGIGGDEHGARGELGVGLDSAAELGESVVLVLQLRVSGMDMSWSTATRNMILTVMTFSAIRRATVSRSLRGTPRRKAIG